MVQVAKDRGCARGASVRACVGMQAGVRACACVRACVRAWLCVSVCGIVFVP